MNAKLVCIVLLTAVMFAPDEASLPPIRIPCYVSKDCRKPCLYLTGTPRSKCINRRCKCYG
uniref:Toxin La-alphaKTx5 n=1 Tax=Liocheles australasiae TaxID=431266 RepID=KAXU5_LIOAU